MAYPDVHKLLEHGQNFMEEEMTDSIKPMSKEEAREEALIILDKLAQRMKEKVLAIETGPDIHQNHYGEYLALLGNFEGDFNVKLMACAAIQAGDLINMDNRAGVRSALKIMGY
jgi:hypothetical protein